MKALKNKKGTGIIEFIVIIIVIALIAITVIPPIRDSIIAQGGTAATNLKTLGTTTTTSGD